jgi:hypothetical protein
MQLPGARIRVMITDSFTPVQEFALQQAGRLLHAARLEVAIRYDDIEDEWSLVIVNHGYDQLKRLHAVKEAA